MWPRARWVASAVVDMSDTEASEVAIARFIGSPTTKLSPGVNTTPPPTPKSPAKNPAVAPSASARERLVGDGWTGWAEDVSLVRLGAGSPDRTNEIPLHKTSNAVTIINHRGFTMSATQPPATAKIIPHPPQRHTMGHSM